MVLPEILIGGAATYGMYHLGESLALPSSVKDAPPKTALSMLLGGATAGAGFSLQHRLLGKRFSYKIPTDFKNWDVRDVLRVASPFVAARVAKFSAPVAIVGGLLGKRFSRLLASKAPAAKTERRGLRDFLRLNRSFVATRVAMASTSLALLGFVSTKVDVARAPQQKIVD